MNNEPLTANLIIAIATCLPAVIMMYLSASFQRLNSAQIERLFDLEEDETKYKGFKTSYIFSGTYFSSVLLEIVCLITFYSWMISTKSSIEYVVLFILFVTGLELFARFILPDVFPMQSRENLNNWEKWILLLTAYFFFVPAWITSKVTDFLKNTFQSKNVNDRMAQAEETIRTIIDAGEKDGVFLSNEGEMLQSIVELSDTIVREVMTPRIDLEAIEIASSIDDFIQMIVETGYSKIPVYRNRVDDITGILYAKDVLKFWKSNGEDVTLEHLKRPATFVPETKRISILLQEFQKEKNHLAIVVDEFGGVAGLVTIEDLLEEIVGEIHDEYDHEEETLLVLSDVSWEVAAKIDLDELGEELDVEFPEDNYETLGGFLFHQFGRVPLPGESHIYEDMNFKVIKADERRIETVVVTKITESDKIDSEKENGSHDKS